MKISVNNNCSDYNSYRVVGERQDEALATWEPSIDRPPAFRPDLILLEHKRDD